MPLNRLRSAATQYLRTRPDSNSEPISSDPENESKCSRRDLLAGLGLAGALAVAGSASMLSRPAQAATMLGGHAAATAGASANAAETGETDLDDAEVIQVRHRRRRRRRRRYHHWGRRRRRRRRPHVRGCVWLPHVQFCWN
jgi:hypothetical protein